MNDKQNSDDDLEQHLNEPKNLPKISDLNELKKIFEEFQSGNQVSTEVIIPSQLRKPMREFKTLFPDTYYVALGLQTTYTLRISKQPIKVTLEDLSPKSLSTFIEISNLKIPERIPKGFLNYVVDLLDPYYGTRKLVDLFLDAISNFHGEKELQSQTWDLQKTIAQHIQKNPGYKEWIEAKIPEIPMACKPCVVSPSEKGSRFSSVYVPENDRQYFIGVDLKSANFQSLREFAPTLVDNCATWAEFLRNFTDSEYFFECKRFRMKCFSYSNNQKQFVLDPNKQKKMWENMTKQILQKLIDCQLFHRDEFAAWNSDELVFRVDHKSAESKVSKCQQVLCKFFPFWQLRVTSFQLRKISPKQPFFAVLRMDGRVDFKCCNAEELPQVIKKWEGRELDKKDVTINRNKVIDW